MSDYEVGHGKPPKATQFKPGASGNPKGRPKGTSSASDEIHKMLTTPIVVKQNGKPIKMTLPAMARKQLAACIAKGDMKAIKWVLEYGLKYEKAQPTTAAGLSADSSSFELTPEEMENISKELLLKDKT